VIPSGFRIFIETLLFTHTIYALFLPFVIKMMGHTKQTFRKPYPYMKHGQAKLKCCDIHILLQTCLI
jgi:hypothetical protein